jgi:hypothetical protein
VPSIDLCTLADVSQFLQKPVADTGQDAVISSLITAASRAIGTYCNRQFTSEGTASHVYSVKFNGYRRGYVDLVPHDLQSATSVKLDTDQAAPTTLTADEYRLLPKSQSGDGVFTYMLLQPYGLAGSLRWPEREVTITGTWGFPSVPEDVKQACVVTVTTWMRRDVSAFSTTYSLDESRVERPEALPSAVRALLSQYMRPVM